METAKMDEQENGTDSSQEERLDNSSPDQGEGEAREANGGEAERDPMMGQEGDALAWLEGPAFDSPIEEMPTLQWPDVEAEAKSAASGDAPADQASGAESGEAEQDPDELEDAMDWLESLAKEQGTPLDEMPTLVSSGERQADSADFEEQDQDLVEIGDTTPPPQLDSDPMAWLEQLAIDQNSPLEDLPSVADRLLASEIVSQNALEEEQALEPLASQPLELEAALRYLEEQAAAQGIKLDEVSIEDIEADDSIEEDLDNIDKIAALAAAATVAKRTADLTGDEHRDQDQVDAPPPASEAPEDPDAALAWLSELSEDEADLPTPPAAPAEQDVASSPRAEAAADEMIGEESVVEPEAEEAEEAAEEEQDEERGEAGSLLKKGIAAVGAAQVIKSLGENADEPQDVGEPQTDVEDGADILDGMPDDPDEALAWMGQMAEEEEAEDLPPARAEESAAQAEESADGDGGSILKKGAAVAGAARLAKSAAGDDTEAAAESGAIDEDILQGMPDDPDEAMAWMAGLAAEDAVSQKKEAGEIEEAAEEPPPATFAGAQSALAAGDVDGAVWQYRALLESGGGAQELIADLEKALGEGAETPELLQLLGDAYMQDGQMQKALRAYSRGFDQS